MLAPEDEKFWLCFLHPSLPFRIGRDVGPVIVKEIALNLRLPRLIKKVEFVGPQIGVIAFHVRIVADVAGSRGRERKEIRA